MKKPASAFGFAPWIVGTLAAAYVAGAVTIHLMGPVQFIFRVQDLPPLPAKCLMTLYGDWVLWFY